MATPSRPPSAVLRAVRKLGADIKDARRRRRLTTALVAERAFTTRKTLQRIERGEHQVSIGIYASVLHVLGMIDNLSDLADLSGDEVGLAAAAAELPIRVRTPKP